MKYLIGLTILFTIFSSCTKFGKNVTVKGKVLNPVTGQGIEGIEIQLQRETWGLPGGNKAIKSTYSDGNGDFEISKLGLRSYTLRAQTGVDLYNIGWFENGEDVTGTGGMLNVRRGKTMHVEYRAVEYGCLKWHIENINCQGSSDSMWFRMKYQFDENFPILWGFPVVGCFNVQGTDCDKFEQGNHILEIKVKRSGVISSFFDTVYVNANVTTNYHLTY